MSTERGLPRDSAGCVLETGERKTFFPSEMKLDWIEGQTWVETGSAWFMIEPDVCKSYLLRERSLCAWWMREDKHSPTPKLWFMVHTDCGCAICCFARSIPFDIDWSHHRSRLWCLTIAPILHIMVTPSIEFSYRFLLTWPAASVLNGCCGAS